MPFERLSQLTSIYYVNHPDFNSLCKSPCSFWSYIRSFHKKQIFSPRLAICKFLHYYWSDLGKANLLNNTFSQFFLLMSPPTIPHPHLFHILLLTISFTHFLSSWKFVPVQGPTKLPPILKATTSSISSPLSRFLTVLYLLVIIFCHTYSENLTLFCYYHL